MEVLTRTLENCREHDPTLSSFVIHELVELKALEALPLIQDAFRQHQVDTSIRGDYQDIEVDLGIRSARSLPARYPSIGETIGMAPPTRPEEINWSAVGRNDSCPCGSGLKFKKCCINRQRPTAGR
ncbi:MAG: lyase HEAT-like repeat protein [Armatimonadetes bacterium]|nr:lyase HEAT-like repeat protein [Armatimonadota bacterium]